MIDGIDQYYQQIAQHIENAIPDNWETAQLVATFFPQCSEYLGEYKRKPDGVERGFPVNNATGKIFRQLRKAFKESGKPPWGKAVFLLNESGEFKMNWLYDDCDENGNQIFDEEVERKKSMDRVDRLTRPD